MLLHLEGVQCVSINHSDSGWCGGKRYNFLYLIWRVKKYYILYCATYGCFILRTFWAAASVPGCHGSWVRESSTERCRCPPYSVLFVWADIVQNPRHPREGEKISLNASCITVESPASQSRPRFNPDSWMGNSRRSAASCHFFLSPHTLYCIRYC